MGYGTYGQQGFVHDPFIGLQAAGWVAYEYYLDSDRLFYSDPSHRWALEQFEKLPGHIILNYYGDPRPNNSAMEKVFEAKMNAVRDATLHLQRIVDEKRSSMKPSKRARMKP